MKKLIESVFVVIFASTVLAISLVSAVAIFVASTVAIVELFVVLSNDPGLLMDIWFVCAVIVTLALVVKNRKEAAQK